MTEMISSYNLLLRERDDLRQALARLHAWVLAEQDDFVCSAEHPIAQAAAALASHGVVASAAAHPDHWICAMAKALNALEHAQCGLRWYRDRCPEAVDGSDDEADEMIDAAVAGLKLALNRNAGVEVCPECGPVTKCHGVGPGTECPHGVPASPRRLRRDEVIALISPLSNNSADHDIEFAQRVMDACGMGGNDGR